MNKQMETRVRVLKLPGLFTIDYPEDWRSESFGNGIVIKHEGYAGSGLFIDTIAADWAKFESSPTKLLAKLKESLEAFVNERILIGSNVEVTDADGGSLTNGDEASCRGVLNMNDGSTWLIDISTRIGLEWLYVLHWHGPSDVLDHHILPIADSFKLIRPT